MCVVQNKCTILNECSSETFSLLGHIDNVNACYACSGFDGNPRKCQVLKQSNHGKLIPVVLAKRHKQTQRAQWHPWPFKLAVNVIDTLGVFNWPPRPLWLPWVESSALIFVWMQYKFPRNVQQSFSENSPAQNACGHVRLLRKKHVWICYLGNIYGHPKSPWCSMWESGTATWTSEVSNVWMHSHSKLLSCVTTTMRFSEMATKSMSLLQRWCASGCSLCSGVLLLVPFMLGWCLPLSHLPTDQACLQANWQAAIS